MPRVGKFIDFSCADQREKFQKILGILPRDKFPMTHKSYDLTLKQTLQKDAALLCAEEEDGWGDGSFIWDVRRKGGSVSLKGVVTSANHACELIAIPYICHKENPQLLEAYPPLFSYPPEWTMEVETEFQNTEPGDTVGICGIFIGRDSFLRATLSEERLLDKGLLNDLENGAAGELNLTVDNPVHSATAPGTPIVISYGRSARAVAEGDAVDYRLPELRLKDFYFPLSGHGEFKDDRKRFREVEEPYSSSSVCMLVNTDSGGLLNYTGEFRENVKETEKGFSWDFQDKNWNNNPDFTKQITFGVKLYFALEYMRNDGGSNTMLVNCENDQTPDKVKIDEIKIYWGCLCRDMMIMMADGSLKQVQDIQIGDIVYGDSPQRVVNIISGTESQGVLRLAYAACQPELMLSFQHPVMTKQGFRLASELAIGDEISTAEGYKALTEKEVVCIGKQVPVYNIELGDLDGNRDENGAVFYAQGIAVGDNRAQGYAMRDKQKRDTQLYGLSREWMTDYKNAIKLEGGKLLMQRAVLWKEAD